MQEGKDNFLKNMSVISKHKNDPDTSCLNKDALLSTEQDLLLNVSNKF